MIPRLLSYCEIVTPVHDIMNDKWITYLCHDMESIIFNHFETFQDKRVSNIIDKYFHQSKNVIPYEFILVYSSFTDL